MKVICIESVIVQKKLNKNNELFTSSLTYKVCEESWLVDFYALGEVSIYNNQNEVTTFRQFDFEEHFKQIN